MKLHAENAKIRGKKSALDTDSSLGLTLKKACEITSSAGIAIKTSSSFTVEAEGGKFDGAQGAILATSSVTVEASSLAISSSGAAAITATSSVKLDLTDSTVTATSPSDAAIACDMVDLTLVNTKVQGSSAAINGKNSLKLKASKASRITATTGYALLATSNADVTIADAAVEGAMKALKASVNTRLNFTPGARVAGKRGAIDAEGNLDLEATGATIDGGVGPRIAATYNAKISTTGGVLKGSPAIQLQSRPSSLSLSGTSVVGDQHVPK
jgi:hypothetical protein